MLVCEMLTGPDRVETSQSLTLSLPSSKSTFSQPFKEKCGSKVVSIVGSIIIFYLSKLWKANEFFMRWCCTSGEAAGEILGVKGTRNTTSKRRQIRSVISWMCIILVRSTDVTIRCGTWFSRATLTCVPSFRVRIERSKRHRAWRLCHMRPAFPDEWRVLNKHSADCRSSAIAVSDGTSSSCLMTRIIRSVLNRARSHLCP